jgi:hypothetical protein
MSFYPGRETITDTVLSHLPSRIGPGNEHLVDINDGETDIESENDWFTEPPPMEPAGRTSSKASEAMLVEVSTSPSYYYYDLQVFCSVQSGRALHLMWAQWQPMSLASQQVTTWQHRRRTSVVAMLPLTQSSHLGHRSLLSLPRRNSCLCRDLTKSC